ncbi:MAG TPA: hypothetical protein VG405_01470 [Solirubrobacteraceae bacterium]|nr:hypothetical protein [Solirubrobacteraceae bacterium]
MTSGAIAASAIGLLAVAPAAGARAFPTHPFVPGSVVVDSTEYPAQGDPLVQLGQNLPSGSPSVTDGRYPEVFNNDVSADPNFAVQTPIHSAPNIFPFGIWFANPTTLYVADENAPVADSSNPYAGVSADTMAGLQKWTFNATAGKWQNDYTLQDGLSLGQPYTVPGYPTGTNSYTGGPWAPATEGLRNISGHLNSDGTATIYATTSTVSGSGDAGADPNEVVKITDNVSSPTAGGESFQVLAPPKNRVRYGGVAAVPSDYGSGS